MITDALQGEHPQHLLATGRRDEFVARMANQVLRALRLPARPGTEQRMASAEARRIP